MSVFVDTSAFYAVLDRDDHNHGAARAAWKGLFSESEDLLTNNYVLLEMSALLQHRLGIAALRAFYEEIVPIVTVDWITEQQHRAAVAAALSAARRKLSVVDCVSFQTMRDHDIRRAFCFDRHFREQGFDTVP